MTASHPVAALKRSKSHLSIQYKPLGFSQGFLPALNPKPMKAYKKAQNLELALDSTLMDVYLFSCL